MGRRRKLLLVATVALTIGTVLWGIGLHQHIQAHRRFVEGFSEFEREWGLWDSWYAWGNGPILIVSGLLLTFTWVILIIEWWSFLKRKSIER